VTFIFPTNRILVDGKATVMLDCPVCEMRTPHKISEEGRTCGVCGNVQKRGGIAS
jgi:hypothetical protein